MSRLTGAAIVLIATSSVAHADMVTEPPGTAAPTPVDAPAGVAPPDMSDQAVGAAIGVAGGGRTTPGGLRISGHYLYQMSDADWFDGTAQFTFGSGAAACFRDRMDDTICQHGLVDGVSAEVGANVRHFLGGQGEFWPYVRLGVGLALVRYGDDDVTGLAIPFHGGGGFRVTVADGVAVIAEAAIDLGFGRFSNGLGLEPQLGASVMGGVEFRL